MKIWLRLILCLCALALALLPGASLADPGPGSINGRVVSLFVTPDSPPLIYASIQQRISPEPYGSAVFAYYLYRSTDGGDTWRRVEMKGLEGTSNPYLLAVDYMHPTTLYLRAEKEYSYTQLFKSTDGGANWAPLGEVFGFPPGGITALAVDFRDPNILYAGRAGSCYGPCGEFVRSTDGGLTWSPFDQTLEEGRYRQGIRIILVDPNDPHVLYAETVYDYRSLSVTLLRGDTQGNWQVMPSPPTAGYGHFPAGLAFDPSTDTLYTGSRRSRALHPPSEDQRLWKTTNPRAADVSTVTWSQVYHWDMGTWDWGADIESVKPLAVDARTRKLFLQTTSADAALWRSTDEGATWQYVKLPPPLNMPGTDPRYTWTAPTGYEINGNWLGFLKGHGDTDNLGYPRTPVIADPMMGGQTVQYFQRMILEWHPENPAQYRIQRRLLGDILYPGADPPHDRRDPPPGPYYYFPFSPDRPTGLGHFVANYTRTGQPLYFKDYFDSHGMEDAFGYPKEEPKWRQCDDGVWRWTQRFQAAVFEYHPEFDRDGYLPGTDIPYRNYRVMLELLGDKYIARNKLPYE